MELPRCVVRSVVSDILVFSSNLPFAWIPQNVRYESGGGPKFLDQSGSVVSEKEIGEFVSSSFTSIFGKNPDTHWRTNITKGDVWVVVFLQPWQVQFRLNALSCSGEELLLQVRTLNREETTCISSVNQAKMHVEYAAYFELMSDSSASLEIKILSCDIAP